MYAAVEDRSTRFHLLHKKDLAPVEQHIVRKEHGRGGCASGYSQKRLLCRSTPAVMLEPEDLEKLVPAESRGIQLTRFVAPRCWAISGMSVPTILGRMGTRRVTFALGQALAQPT